MITRESFVRHFATVYLFRHPAWAVAYVQQRRVSRGSRGFGSVVHSVFPLRLQMLALAITAGLDRSATDALFEHRERQSPNAEAPSLGLYG